MPTATKSINGVQVVSNSDFNSNPASITKPVVLQGTNVLAGEVRGKPDGSISVQIIGVDLDQPTISASVDPAANANGWNRTNVTVTFTAVDPTSGIATVPPPSLFPPRARIRRSRARQRTRQGTRPASRLR